MPLVFSGLSACFSCDSGQSRFGCGLTTVGEIDDIWVRDDVIVRDHKNYVLSNSQNSIANFLTINHNGSFTSAAQTANAENIIIHRDFPELAALFTRNWEHLWGKSQAFEASY